MGNPKICKLGKNEKTAITPVTGAANEKGEQIRDEKNITDKVTKSNGDKSYFKYSKILKTLKSEYNKIIMDGKPVNLSELVERIR